MKKKLVYETQIFPGLTLTEEKLADLVKSLKEVASTCFESTPNYQALSGKKEELDRAVITLAKNDKGEVLGFCSSLVLDIPTVGEVLHLGLTCVRPDARGLKLTHKLTSKLLMKYLFTKSPFQNVWISNVACVLSSLGNVAMYFEDVFPSPYASVTPTYEHLMIAREIGKNYKEQLAINENAYFNEDKFVFEASVEGTVFEKGEEDRRFHHRNTKVNEYYKTMINFERGDEVLQIGKVSLFTFPKYLARTVKVKTKASINGFQEKMNYYAN